MSGTLTALVRGNFALATAVLVQARLLMHEITRTVEEWRKLKNALCDKNTNDDHAAEDNYNKIQS